MKQINMFFFQPRVISSLVGPNFLLRPWSFSTLELISSIYFWVLSIFNRFRQLNLQPFV